MRTVIKAKMALLALVSLLTIVVPAQAQTTIQLGFANITATNAGDAAIGEAQLFVDVTDAGSGEVLFTFYNTGPEDSSITDVYFDDGSLLGIALIDNSDPGVSFSQGASPANLPGANNAIPPFQTTAGFSADSDAPVQQNGVNPTESLGIHFGLVAGRTFDDVLADLTSGDLRIGIHVQGFESGGSEAFVNTETGTIDIEKSTNGQDADTPTGPVIPVDDPVSWTYRVENTGNVDLTNVTVVDDNGTPGDTSDDYTCVIGDLAAGAVDNTTCSQSGTAVAGQYANMATVTGDYGDTSVSDEDPSHYFGEEPTAITLASFAAEAGVGSVTLAWQTAAEIDNAGFNVYRAAAPDGPYTKVNSALIAAEGDPTSGASYSFLDQELQPGTYYYKLEDVDLSGVTTLHGPASAVVMPRFRRPSYRPTSPW